MCINRNTRYSYDKRSRRIRIWTIAIAIYTTSSTAHKSIFGKIDIIQLREYFLFQHHGITIISKLKAKVEKGEERKEATLIENGVTNGLLLQHSNFYFPLHEMFCILIRIYNPIIIDQQWNHKSQQRQHQMEQASWHTMHMALYISST